MGELGHLRCAVVLLVDATQGVQAQTVANAYLAIEHDLTIVPVLNKVDMAIARPDEVIAEMNSALGIDPDEVLKCSAKTGLGVDEILAAIRGFQEKPVDAARLDAARKRLRYSVATQMQSSDAIASILARYVALRRTPETINRLHEQYARLTPEDVKQAAAKYLVEASRTIVTLAPAGGAR